MNPDVVAAVLRRAHAIGEQQHVLAVLNDADEFSRVGLPPTLIPAVQAAYLLTRTTDDGLDVTVRDLLTTAATATALSWRATIYAERQTTTSD